MPNPYFRFKQFVIRQDRCAMKVCTDACLFGAWTARRMKSPARMLDIGTGTGLLALMLAQQSEAPIDAIELDPDSFEQAVENRNESPWKDRIEIYSGDVRDWVFPVKYELIVTNPPFFESDLPSPEKKKNQAKHDVSLALDELLRAIKKNLSEDGMFSILLPFHRRNYFEQLAEEHGFFPAEKLSVRQSPAHSPFRIFYLFGREKKEPFIHPELTIKNEAGTNSDIFSEWMSAYYL